MKYAYLLLLLGLSACQYNYPKVSNASPLSNFPMPPSHQREVDIYPAGKLPADTAFVKLIRLEAQGNPALPDTVLLNVLRKKAQAEGADAVLIEKKKEEKKLITLSGTAIRYKNRLGYVRAYLKWQKVYIVSTTGVKTHAFTVAYDFDRYIWKIIPEKRRDADSLFYNYSDRYSPYHLLEEKNGWTYRKDKSGKDIQRNYYVDGIKIKRLNLSYPEPGKIQVNVYYSGQGDYLFPDVVVYELNDKKQVVRSTIVTGEGDILREKFTYDELGRMDSSTMSRVSEERETQFLINVYEYFQPDDLM